MEKESIERTKLYEISDRRSDRGVDAPRTGYSRLSDANACDVDANFELHRRDLGNLVEEGVVSFLTLRRENSFDTVPIRTREHNEREGHSHVFLSRVFLCNPAPKGELCLLLLTAGNLMGTNYGTVVCVEKAAVWSLRSRMNAVSQEGRSEPAIFYRWFPYAQGGNTARAIALHVFQGF